MKLIALLDRIPPKLCRLLARKDRGRTFMTNQEIARRACLAKSTVWAISQLHSWQSVPARTIERFANACDVDLLVIGKQKKFLRRAKRAYYKSTSPAQKRMIAKFLSDIAGSRRKYAADSSAPTGI